MALLRLCLKHLPLLCLLLELDLDLNPERRSLRPLWVALSALWPLGVRLTGSALSGRERASRAWVAGQWAKAVLDSRIHSQNRTPPLDLRSRFYAIARADGVDCPVVYRSSASYCRAIGSLEGSDSVSQSFPCEAETMIYLVAAGFQEGDIRLLP